MRGRRGKGSEKGKKERETEDLMTNAFFVPFFTSFRFRNLSSYDVGKGPDSYFWLTSADVSQSEEFPNLSPN